MQNTLPMACFNVYGGTSTNPAYFFEDFPTLTTSSHKMMIIENHLLSN